MVRYEALKCYELAVQHSLVIVASFRGSSLWSVISLFGAKGFEFFESLDVLWLEVSNVFNRVLQSQGQRVRVRSQGVGEGFGGAHGIRLSGLDNFFGRH